MIIHGDGQKWAVSLCTLKVQQTLPADGFDSGNVGERPKFLISVLTLRF